MGGVGVPAQPVHPWVAEGQRRVRFGVQPWPGWDWPAFLAMASEAEALGFDSFWTYDHPLGGRDCWAGLAAVAPRTSHLRLGTLASCVYYRSPLTLARLAADVDHLSRGRLVLGLGLGDSQDEFARMGLPWPAMRERHQLLEETIAVTYGLWGAEPFTYHGRQVHVDGAHLNGSPLQDHVPLLIAGGGERRTLRLVAQYADMANFGQHAWLGGAVTVADVQRKWATLRSHCAALQRPYAAILRSHFSVAVLAETSAAVEAKLAALPAATIRFLGRALLAGTPAELVASYQALVEAGTHYFVVGILGDDTGTLPLLGKQVVPAVV